MLAGRGVGNMLPNEAPYISKRPEENKRRFKSDAVEALIREMEGNIGDKELAWMFSNCFPNTLDTTVFYNGNHEKPDTYIITGDIDAMWLRDSSAQVNAYLPLCKRNAKLAKMVEGLIHRQAQCILLDAYANAFYRDATKVSQWKDDLTDMKPGLHERKWELDSLCYVIRLCWRYWTETGNKEPFDKEWFSAMKKVVETMKDQQRMKGKGNYHFQRITETQTDTLPGGGYGNPWKPTGMICSAFRNSDDAAMYLFNIPENLFAVVSLRQLAKIVGALFNDEGFAKECTELSDEVEKAVLKYGMVEHPVYGRTYVYECDGYGNYLMMEDAGVPGLISIPYLGYGEGSKEVSNCRRFALSNDNPYFYSGKEAQGTGSPHLANHGDMIWPMGIIMRALTSTDDAEIKYCLGMLKKTHAGTGFIHESFNPNNPEDYSRPWFAWVNNLFGELIIKVYKERPHLLKG